jgi:hypothetical protein
MDPSVLLKQRSVRWDDPLDDYAKLQTLRQMMDQRRIREQQYQLQQQAMQEHARKAQYEQEDRTRQMNLREFLSQNPNATFTDIAKFDVPTALKYETERNQMQTAQLTRQQKEAELLRKRMQDRADVLYSVQGQGQPATDEAVMLDLLKPENQRLGLGKIGQETPLALTEPQLRAQYSEAYSPTQWQALKKGETDAQTADLKTDEERFKAVYPLIAGASDQDAWTAAIKTAPIQYQRLFPPRFSTANKQKALSMWVPAGEAARMGVVNDPKEIIAAINNPETPREDIPRLRQQLKDIGDYQQSIQRDRLLTPAEFAQQLELAKARSAALQEGKPPTQGEELLAGYAARVAMANKGFEHLTMGTGEMAWNRLTPNFLNTEAGKNFAQDERNFINAIMRRESGAAISPGEFSSAREQYIPQPNDPPSTLEKKRRNRLVVQQSLIRGSGRAYVDPDELLRQAGVDVPTLGGGGSQPPPAGAKPALGDIPNPLLDTKKPTHRFNPTTGEMKTVTR